MSPPQRALAVVALLLLAAAAVPPAAGTGTGPASEAGTGTGPVEVAGQGPVPVAQQGAAGLSAQAVDPDSVTMAVALQPDGDATWTVTYYVRLEDDNETAAFESLRDDVEADPANYTERFGDRMRSTVGTAADATGREMAVRNVTVDARIQDLGRTYGVLEYTFEWTNFAVVDGERITAGDALAGLFLDEQTTLVVSWPEGYELVEARPSPDDEVGDERTVGWAGPEDFGRDEPRVVVEPRSDGLLADLPGGTLVGVLLLALAGVAAAVVWSRRRGAPAVPGAGTGDGTASGGETGADGATASADAGTGGAAGGAGDDEPPMELLSNEEKVMKVVRQRGGRVKQQEIVEALDWTEAKTSQVVRDLRDEGELDGFRLGRENVLRLPEADDDEL